MENGSEKYIETVRYLGKLYDFCNEKLFGGNLKKPVITVQQDIKNKTNGWWSTKKVWKENSDDEGEYEFNVTAQQLNRPVNQIAASMIHDMCHQYATSHGLQDTSRSGNYHNKLFAKIAETHGLKVACVPTVGWSNTELTAETEALIAEFVKDNPENLIYRLLVMKGQSLKNLSIRKYICPVCGNSVRASKAVRIMCLDCNQPMQEELEEIK